MKPPRKIRVGPHVFRIVSDTDGLMDGYAVGHCNADRQVIAVDPRMPFTARADTVLHELLHACLGALKLDSEVEEQLVLLLSPQLLAILRDNPRLVAYLVAQ